MPPTVVTSLTVVVGASGDDVAQAASSRLSNKGSTFVFMGEILAFIRQLNTEMRAALARHQLDIAVVRQHILAHDRQADAVAMARSLRLVQALVERIENPLGVGRRHARPLVDAIDAHPAFTT